MPNARVDAFQLCAASRWRWSDNFLLDQSKHRVMVILFLDGELVQETERGRRRDNRFKLGR